MFKLFGLTLAAVGFAHFVKPELFRGITQTAFPNNTDAAILQNGAIETAAGLAIACPKHRRLGLLGLTAYGGWLGYNASKGG
jgi:uncharacterized membrane protein